MIKAANCNLQPARLVTRVTSVVSVVNWCCPVFYTTAPFHARRTHIHKRARTDYRQSSR